MPQDHVLDYDEYMKKPKGFCDVFLHPSAIAKIKNGETVIIENPTETIRLVPVEEEIELDPYDPIKSIKDWHKCPCGGEFENKFALENKQVQQCVVCKNIRAI